MTAQEVLQSYLVQPPRNRLPPSIGNLRNLDKGKEKNNLMNRRKYAEILVKCFHDNRRGNVCDGCFCRA